MPPNVSSAREAKGSKPIASIRAATPGGIVHTRETAFVSNGASWGRSISFTTGQSFSASGQRKEKARLTNASEEE